MWIIKGTATKQKPVTSPFLRLLFLSYHILFISICGTEPRNKPQVVLLFLIVPSAMKLLLVVSTLV